MEYHDHIGEDTDHQEAQEFIHLAGESKREYQAWLARQDKETQAEERLFRSDGL